MGNLFVKDFIALVWGSFINDVKYLGGGIGGYPICLWEGFF